MRRFIPAARTIGLLLMLFSLSTLPPAGIALVYNDHSLLSFLASFIIMFFCGLSLWLPFKNQSVELKQRDGFLVVVLFWILFSLLGAAPFYLYFFPHLAFVDALFESTSGLTTTGASVFVHLDNMPHSILYYRQQLHFLGGLGVIVFALAVLPVLGIGGMQLYQAETSDVFKTEKIRPRLSHVAKSLWYAYLGLAALCAVLYWLAGMSMFDAIGESFSTVSTGGFSIHDDNFGHYHSQLINIIAVTFMFLGSVNFGLHYQFIHHRNLRVYLASAECRAYFKLLLSTSLFIALLLVITHRNEPMQALLNSFFHVVSIASTTGYITTDITHWPNVAPLLLMLLALIGGCGGSTAGGIKIIRCLLFKEQAKNELKHMVHPQGYFIAKLNNQPLSPSILIAVWGFAAVFGALFILLFFLLYATGLDLLTSATALIGCIANAGTGLGQVFGTFAHINVMSKWILIFAMIVGRLEVFPILVLLTPQFWRE